MKAVPLVVSGLALGLGSLLSAPTWAAEYTAVMTPDIKWTDAPSIGPGAKSAVIDGDPKGTGPFVMRLKLPPNSKIKTHTHPADENVTILSGTLYFSSGDKFEPKMAKAFGPGSYFSIAKGKPMFAFTKDKEAVIQLHGMGPWGIAYLEPETPAKSEAPAKKK